MAFNTTEATYPSPCLPRTPPPVERSELVDIYRTGWGQASQLANPDAWKPPNEWECSPTRGLHHIHDIYCVRAPSLEEKPSASPVSGDAYQYTPPDLVALQREVRMMGASSPELTLANLKFAMGASSDAMVYKELESTKKRWMFSVLLQNKDFAHLDWARSHPETLKSCRQPRILAIYETQGNSRYPSSCNTDHSLIRNYSINIFSCWALPWPRNITSINRSGLVKSPDECPADPRRHYFGVCGVEVSSAATVY